MNARKRYAGYCDYYSIGGGIGQVVWYFDNYARRVRVMYTPTTGQSELEIARDFGAHVWCEIERWHWPLWLEAKEARKLAYEKASEYSPRIEDEIARLRRLNAEQVRRMPR